ncbi:MAG: cytidylate kinase-like family protein [Spirochaetaceae bacterium]|jgi:cytidylate kinase|nr:cytidylate kinase-like family protein [Spirochaetaceae bacterium]
MSIITISRELAALGDETAKEISKQLSCRLIDKHVLEERIKTFDVSVKKLEKYDGRKPSFFSSLSEDREEYLHYLKAAILAEAIEGDCVFIGRGAFVVLEGIPGVLPVFLVSSYKARIERVKSYFRCDEKRAWQIIEQSDRDRSGFHKFFFERDWKDPDNYHITLNTGALHPEICAELIKNCAQSLINDEVKRECALRLQEKTCAQRIIHHIQYERHIGVHFLNAEVSGGVVRLYGVANSPLMVETASAAAKEISGIERVFSEIQIMQEYSIRPYKI